MKKHSAIKLLALSLVLVLLLPCALSCKARELGQSKLAATAVGTVGEYSVQYEELYFLAHNYAEAVKEKYGSDTDALKAAVLDYVNENITANYAIITLCKENGLVYNEDELREDVKRSVELMIQSEFGNNRSDYLESQNAMGLTDHYVRFTLGVDMLYNKLATKLKTEGKIPNSDKDIKAYIKDNFIHTWHIAIFVNEGDDRAAKLAKAEEALAKLDAGEKTMFDLIGSTYNEDLIPSSLSNAYGYYFPRGIMDSAYENAAFDLNVGQHTKVVEGYGENNDGAYVECLYIIERLQYSDAEVEENFTVLSDMMAEAIVGNMSEDIRADLTFTMNDFGKSLDLTNLEAPKNGIDYQMWTIIGVCALGVAAVVAVVISVRVAKAKKFRKDYGNKPAKK